LRDDAVFLAGAAAWALALGLLFFYLLVYVGHTVELAAYPYDVDQGEGYDVNSGWLIARGRPIYSDNEQFPYYSSNYPPLYSLALALIVGQTGPTLAAGRLLSAVAALATALVIGVLVQQRSRSSLAGASAGLLFVSSIYVFHTTPLARVNAVALLLAVLGLACCYGRGWSWQIGAIVLFVAALFAKQTMVDAVAAGVLAIVLRGDVRRGLLMGAAIGLIGGAIFIVVDRLHGGQFWVNVVVGNVNPFDVRQALSYFRNFLETHLIVVALAALEVIRAARARRVGPLELYWLLALLLAVSVGKWGAGESYFLAPIAASSALAGLALARVLREVAARAVPTALFGVGLLLQGLLFAHGPLYEVGPLLVDRGAQASVLGRAPGQAEVEAAAPLMKALREADGPVLVEDAAYSLAAGKEVVGNATHLRNLLQAGVWSPEPLVADLEARRFSWVVLDAELYPEPVLAAIGRYYYLYEEYEINGTRQQLFAPGEE
jgi:hypothetical protein